MPFYRDSKQNLGLDDYEMRKIKGARRHTEMVFTAHALLVLGPAFAAANISSSPSEKKEESQQSPKLAKDIRVAKAEASFDQIIGSRRRGVYMEVLTNLLVFARNLCRKLKEKPRSIAQVLLSSKTILS